MLDEHNTLSGGAMTKANPQPEVQHVEHGAEPQGPDGGYGWVMVGAMFVSNMLVFGVIRSLGVFFVEFVEYFEESAQAISWISSIGLAAEQIFSPLGTALCNAYGARPVVMAGGCLTGLGLILASQAKCLTHLYLTMGGITGLGWALVFTPMMATVMRCFTRRRSLALSLGFTGIGISCFAFSPLFQLLVDTYSWRGSLLILGGLSLNLVACGALIRPQGGQIKVVAKEKTESRSSCSAFLWQVYSYLELSLIFQRPFVTYCVAITLFNGGYFIPYIHLVAHARQVGFSEYQAAFVISATGVTDMVGRVLSGWSADLGHIRLIHWLTLWTSLTGVFIVMLPVATLGGSYAGLIVFSLAYGFCAGALTPVIFSVVPQLVGMDRMVGALGLVMLIESIGALLGAPLSGFLKDYTGSYLASLVLAGSSLILGALVLTTLPHYFSRTDPPLKCSPDSKKEAESSESGLMDNPDPNPDKLDPLETICYSETLPSFAETVPDQNHSLCS